MSELEFKNGSSIEFFETGDNSGLKSPNHTILLSDTSPVTLEEQIRVVAKGRAIFKDMANAKAEAITRWEEDFADLIKSTEEVRTRLQEDEAKLRELTLAAYKETGDKTPAAGVGIRVTDKLEYDPETADRWAWDHALAMKLDVKAFEGYVKAIPSDFPFVTITPTPTATIATNLEV